MASALEDLHALTSVAPLKPIIMVPFGLLLLNLHALTSVAPLKPNTDASIQALPKKSPRSHERGPVEAVGEGVITQETLAYLHALTSVAPLKHIARMDGHAASI